MIRKSPELERRTQSVSALMALVLVLFLIQLWLITVALEDFLAARGGLAVPTFVASGVCFLLNLRLLKYLFDIDRSGK